MAFEHQTRASYEHADEQTEGVAGQAQDKLHDAKQQAQRQAQDMAGQARMRFRGEVDQRSTQAGERIAAQASDMRSVAEQLRMQGKDGPAQLAEQAAQRSERAASYLRDADGDRILGDVEQFARERPWGVVAAGFALGFAASRFLKASSSERYRTTQPRLPGRTGADGGWPAYVSAPATAFSDRPGVSSQTEIVE